MSLFLRIDKSLHIHFDRAADPISPPRLLAAMRHAVFSGGARIRPQLVMAVAIACGDKNPELTNAAAVAIELMHCASLVHDDMPAFDNADTRRGKPTVHKAFGEPLALLTGDALIVMAYQVLLNAGMEQPKRLARLMQNLTSGVGLPSGIVAGQAWECEVTADLGQYQRAKTGALFVASTCAGALACDADPKPWIALGAHLGEAYQVADDIRDVLGQAEMLGKPTGQDVLNGRPSSASALGLGGAVRYFEGLMDKAVSSVPKCASRALMQDMVRQEAERLVPIETRTNYRVTSALPACKLALG
jgi:geranylgeranyl diphosphate synthase type II